MTRKSFHRLLSSIFWLSPLLAIVISLLSSVYVNAQIASDAGQTIQKFVSDNASAGTPGIVLKDLTGGKDYTANSDTAMTAASLYKLFVAQNLYSLKAKGSLNFDAVMTLTPEAVAQWSENIADCKNEQACINAIWPNQPTTKTTVSVNSCLPKMIIYSDNICGKFFLDYSRDHGLYDLLSSSGYSHTSLAPGSLQTSPSDVAKLLTSIAQDRFIDQSSSQEIYNLMLKQAHRTKIPADIPSLQVANKTGEIHSSPYYSHDAAIVKAGGKTYILVVMTHFNPDSSSDDSKIASLAAQIFGQSSVVGSGGGSADCYAPSSASSIYNIYQQLQWPFYDPSGPSGPSGCCSESGDLPSYITDPWRSAFIKAGTTHNVAPALIAALFTAENFTGTTPPKLPDTWKNFNHEPSSGWPTNEFQTQGPFQFIPTTWGPPVNMGEDGDGDGVKDPHNLYDAAAGAAKYAESGGATIDKPVNEWRDFIFSYNRANWYVDMVLSYYKFYASGSTSSTTTSSSYCGGGISPDGFVFPQLTTKSEIKKYGWNPNCDQGIAEMGPGSSNPITNLGSKATCHHSYLAADIFNATGVPVLSPRPGKVVSAHGSSIVGMSVRIYSDKALGGDGLWYYEVHMLGPEDGGGLKVSEGDIVKAGQQVGVVGTNADAQGTPSHTHFDMSPVKNGFTRDYGYVGGWVLNPMPALKAAYERLPD